MKPPIITPDGSGAFFPPDDGPRPMNQFTLDVAPCGIPLRLSLQYDAGLEEHGRTEIREILGAAMRDLERLAVLRHHASTTFRYPSKP